MNQALSSYGVTESMPAHDRYDEAVADLRINGFTILPSGLDPAFLTSLQSALDHVYQDQATELGGEAILQAINDADTVRCALSYDAKFLRVATVEPLLRLAERLFGTEFILTQQNGIINRPEKDNTQARWHRDLPYQHWTSSKPIAINALLCVDDFTCENGATFVLPATHRHAQFPTPGFVMRNGRQLEAPAGSFLVLDAMLFHRAGINSSHAVRRALNHVIGLPFLSQQINIPAAMRQNGKPTPDDPAIQKYLGYRWNPPGSAKEWRELRIR